MATKVEQVPSVETQRVQTSVTSSLGASTSSSKVSMFGAKSGFVIPKNKLSGSLVPIFRGAKKVESHDAGKDESNKQAQRKTKWGTDLTQDAGVRRGRALAYQTRVEQITQQLESGVLETEEDQDSQSQTEAPKEDLSVQQVHDQNWEALEMEKREVIGEILKLNPRYKAPPDYKPLLKEAKVPIPLKVYPGFNFVGLLLGPGSNTQKRLQEETGAKIRLQGTKAGEAEKGEITLSDGGEDQSAYEELYVHVSADTFDKVDAAVALIELLVTPVSGNAVDVSTSPAPVSGNSMAVLDLSKNIIASYALPAAPINPGVMQPIIGSTRPSLSQVQFQPYPAPWFPMGPPQTQMRPLSNFGLPSNSSVHMPNNAMQFSPSRSTARMQPISVGRSPFAGGFGLAPRNPSLVAPRPQMQPQPPQSLQRQYFPEGQPHGQVTDMRGHSIPGPQPPSQYPSLPAQRNTGPPPHQFIGNQYRNTGPVPVPNHPFSMPQPVSVAPSGSQTNRQLASTGWPASVVNPAPIGQNNMMQPSLSMGPSQRTQVFSQPVATSGPLGSFGSFPSHGFSPQLPNNTPVNRPATTFTSSLPQVGSAPSAPIRLSSAVPSVVVRTPSLLAPPASGLPLVFPRAGDPSLAQARSSAPSSAPAPSQSPPVAPRPVGSQGQAANMLMVGSTPVLPPVPSVSPRPQPGNSISMSVTVPSFTPVNPPMTSPQSISPVTALKPQRPSSGDFTFKPLSSQPQASQTVTRPSSDQLVSASTTQTKPINMQPPAPPQAPSFRPATNNGGPQVVMQGFPSSRTSDQFLQPQSPVPAPSPGSVPFSGNRSPMPPPPRPPTFPNRNPVPPTSPVSQMRPQGFMQPPQMSPLPPQRVNPPLQLQQNQAASTVRPGNLFLPNQQHINNVTFSGKPASSPGGNQVYDPFSPTSISSAPQQVENPTKGGNHENDPEYNDLMASVGMK